MLRSLFSSSSLASAACGLAFLMASQAQALDLMLINTELEEGSKAIHMANTPPLKNFTPATTNLDELEFYARAIESSKVDVVGLIEGSNKRLAQSLQERLGDNWQWLNQENSNQTTSIRASFLSRVPALPDSLDNLADTYGFSKNDKLRVKPDAVLSAGFEKAGKRYLLAVSYLTQGGGDYADARYAQADAIRNALFTKCSDDYEFCGVMGNFNDEPGSKALKRIQGVDGIFGDKIELEQSATVNGAERDCSVGQGKQCRLIDHILTSMKGETLFIDVKPEYSAHKISLFIPEQAYIERKISKKDKRNTQRYNDFKNIERLSEQTSRQKSRIEALERENAILRAQLNSPSQPLSE